MASESECVAPGCTNPGVRLKGTLCWGHYQQQWRERRKKAELDEQAESALLRPLRRCSFPGCPKAIHGQGLCAAHWAQQARGVELYTLDRKKPIKWTLNKDGYLYRVVSGKTILQHRRVMEESLGRPLLSEENVHHINGDRSDNRPENLELWSTAQPKGQRVADKVEWAQQMLSLYRPDLLMQEVHYG